jgi:hypothetical protein
MRLGSSPRARALAAEWRSRNTRSVIERVLRVAKNFAEAQDADRHDIAAMSFEERISAVERLRRERFGEDRSQSRLDRVLVCADLPSREVRARRWSRPRRTRGAEADRGSAKELSAPGRIFAPLFVIGREALIANKRAAGRDKDKLDVALLERQGLSRARKRRGVSKKSS